MEKPWESNALARRQDRQEKPKTILFLKAVSFDSIFLGALCAFARKSLCSFDPFHFSF
jgi:hypothetical protein